MSAVSVELGYYLVSYDYLQEASISTSKQESQSLVIADQDLIEKKDPQHSMKSIAIAVKW